MIHKGGVNTDHDALVAVRESISDLSSSYYELIPLSRYKDSVAPPLKSQHDLKQQFDALASLADIEHASKVLLGALFRQSEMHPIDYIYHALNLPIQYLDPTTPEYEVIQKYVKNTSDGALDFQTHKLKVFKV
jgi:Poly(ADP-ribose) polymerase, regulatory domain